MSDFLARNAALLSVVQKAAAGQPIFLVGGAVRDAMLARPVHDLDFVLARDARKVADRVARELHGGFYMLDDQRNTVRVIVERAPGEKFTLDFATYRSDGLEGDLRARDFTINAVALEVSDPHRLVDPLGGAADLREKVIRPCSPSSFTDDPARVMRAVRQSLELQFRLLPETVQAMAGAVNLLPRVSPERLRDELFRIFEGSQVDSAVRLMDHFGILTYLLPELESLKGVTQSAPHISNVWEHTLRVTSSLADLFSALVGGYNADKVANITLSTAVLYLGKFRPEFQAHFASLITTGRTPRALLMLAALYHDIAKPATRYQEETGRVRFLEHEQLGAGIAASRAQALALSSAEVQRLRLVIQHHMRIHLLAQENRAPSRRAIYRYFRAAQKAGVDTILLSLADTLATYGHGLPQERWESELSVCRDLLEAYWEAPHESVSPARVLDGRIIMEKFELPSSPLVGRLLAELEEAQAAGEISDTSNAILFLEQRLKAIRSEREEDD